MNHASTFSLLRAYSCAFARVIRGGDLDEIARLTRIHFVCGALVRLAPSYWTITCFQQLKRAAKQMATAACTQQLSQMSKPPDGVQSRVGKGIGGHERISNDGFTI